MTLRPVVPIHLLVARIIRQEVLAVGDRRALRQAGWWRTPAVLVIAIFAVACAGTSSASTPPSTANATTTATAVDDPVAASLKKAVATDDPARGDMAPAAMVAIAQAICASLKPAMSRMDIAIAGARTAIAHGIPPNAAPSWTELSTHYYCPDHAPG